MKLSAVIDKSLLQAICSEGEPQRVELWRELLSRYQIVIPFVLVEEVWTNLACPRLKKLSVIQEMVRALAAMTSCWIEEEMEIVFGELVQNKRRKRLPAAPKAIVKRVLALTANEPGLLEWLDQAEKTRKQAIADRVKSQRDILGEGKFVVIKNEGELFERYVREQFLEIVASPSRKIVLMEKVFGRTFRQRHSNFKRRIEKAFTSYSRATFKHYPITLSYLMAEMFYFYAPLCRIQPKSGLTPRKIIGSKRAEQINNIQDQKYVAGALICDRLLTCDEGMRNLLQIFRAARLWKGEVVYINPNVALGNQIPQLLR
jgi:hypothetical protein